MVFPIHVQCSKLDSFTIFLIFGTWVCYAVCDFNSIDIWSSNGRVSFRHKIKIFQTLFRNQNLISFSRLKKVIDKNIFIRRRLISAWKLRSCRTVIKRSRRNCTDSKHQRSASSKAAKVRAPTYTEKNILANLFLTWWFGATFQYSLSF